MKLFYRKFGSGPSLVILHGLFGSSDNWVTIAKNISHKFTVYLPDQRNHGKSHHSQIHDYDSLGQDIFEFTEDLNIKKIFLAGHSMGGKVAVNFAVRWPEKINSLIVIDISPFRAADKVNIIHNEHRHILEILMSFDMARVHSRAEAEKILCTRISSEKTRGFLLKNLQRNADNAFSWKMNVEALYNNFENIISGLPDPSTETEQISGFPVTFVKGENSDYLADNEFKKIQTIFPVAEIVTVANAGHWIHSERPDAIEQILLSQLH
jgi:esterase